MEELEITSLINKCYKSVLNSYYDNGNSLIYVQLYYPPTKYWLITCNDDNDIMLWENNNIGKPYIKCYIDNIHNVGVTEYQDITSFITILVISSCVLAGILVSTALLCIAKSKTKPERMDV